MAAFVSKATGNWSASGQTTWVGVGVPASGDTVTIKANHTVTVDVDTTVGNSPASDATVLYIEPSGHLLLAATKQLTVRGRTILESNLTLDDDSIFEIDDNSSGIAYSVHIGEGSLGASGLGKIISTASAGHPAVIRSKSGGVNGFLSHAVGTGNGGQIQGSDILFQRLGTSSVAAWAIDGGSGSTITLGPRVVFDTCGEIVTLNMDPACVFSFTGVTTKNTVSTRAYTIAFTSAPTTGTYNISNCSFDKGGFLTPRAGMTITNTLFQAQPVLLGSVPTWTTFSGCLVYMPTDDFPIVASITDCFILFGTTTGHGLAVSGTQTIGGCVFESLGTGVTNDLILAGAPTSDVTITIENCLKLPNAAGTSSGTLLSALGNSHTSFRFRHNTMHLGGGVDSSGFRVGETYDGFAGMVIECRDNIGWDTTARGYILCNIDASPVSDLVTSANIHHNAPYNAATGSNGVGYDGLSFSSGSAGANDVDAVDPQFVDSARDIASWDTALGGAGTAANALAELAKINDAAGYNSAYTVASLVTWVKAGFAPQSTLLKAASDNVAPSYGWIGAMTGVPAVETGLSDPTAQRAGGGWV